MANQITDNRTLIVNADSVTPFDNLSGAAAGTLDTEIFIQGTGSIGQYLTNTLGGILYDAGTTQSAWANSHFYIWINCGIVGLLAAKASGGFRIRFCGNTVTDFFEFYVGGNDSWPAATAGGWVMFVVDIEATASNTGGTPPATNACRYVGWAGQTGGTMPRMADNTWIDAIWRLGDGNPGIIVEGRNGGTTDWNSADILTQLGSNLGMFRETTGGAYSINAPIQFGINDTTTHGFTDTNAIWLWENQEFAADDLYQISALGNSGGTTNVTMGVKNGTGDDATGAQGLVIAGASTGPIWDMDFNDANLDTIGLYGCSFINGGQFDLDSASVSCISTQYIGCDGALVSNSEQLRISVVDADTADGVAFMTTDDLGDIRFGRFEFSDGHAVELTTPRVATQTSKGNLFSGYGVTTSNDAAIYNNTAGAVTINVTDSGDTPTYRDGTGASTTVQNTVTLQITSTDENANVIPYTKVRIENASTGALISDGVSNDLGVFTDSSYNYAGDVSVNVIVRKNSPGQERYLPRSAPGTITSSGLTLIVSLALDTVAGKVAAFSIMDQGFTSEDESTNAVITAEIDVPTRGTSRKLLVGAFYWDSASNLAVSSATYDGNAMTNIPSASTNEQEGAGNFHEIMFYWYDIPDTDSGEKTVSITWNSNVAIKGIAFALLENTESGAPANADIDSGDQVTTNPTLSLGFTATGPLPVAQGVGFIMVDDTDSPTSSQTIRRSDLVVDELKMAAVITDRRTAGGVYNLAADYGSNSKTWVAGGVTVRQTK